VKTRTSPGSSLARSPFPRTTDPRPGRVIAASARALLGVACGRLLLDWRLGAYRFGYRLRTRVRPFRRHCWLRNWLHNRLDWSRLRRLCGNRLRSLDGGRLRRLDRSCDDRGRGWRRWRNSPEVRRVHPAFHAVRGSYPIARRRHAAGPPSRDHDAHVDPQMDVRRQPVLVEELDVLRTGGGRGHQCAAADRERASFIGPPGRTRTKRRRAGRPRSEAHDPATTVQRSRSNIPERIPPEASAQPRILASYAPGGAQSGTTRAVVDLNTGVAERGSISRGIRTFASG
jgi:hypothetical protein